MARQPDPTVQGVVGADPALSRVGDSARPYCRFRVTVIPTYRTEQGRNNAETIWLTTKMWDQLTVNLSHSLRKGDVVLLTRRLSQESWENDGRKYETNIVTPQATGHDLVRGRSSFARVRAAESAPLASSGAGTGDAELEPSGEERIPSDHWEVEAVALSTSASLAPRTGDPRESAGSTELSESTGFTEPTESAEPTGFGQSSATYVQSPESFVIDPTYARSEDQAGEPWPVYELVDDLVEQALGVS